MGQLVLALSWPPPTLLDWDCLRQDRNCEASAMGLEAHERAGLYHAERHNM